MGWKLEVNFSALENVKTVRVCPVTGTSASTLVPGQVMSLPSWYQPGDQRLAHGVAGGWPSHFTVLCLSFPETKDGNCAHPQGPRRRRTPMWMNYLGQCPAENRPWRKGPGPAVPGGGGGVGREGRQPCPGGGHVRRVIRAYCLPAIEKGQPTPGADPVPAMGVPGQDVSPLCPQSVEGLARLGVSWDLAGRSAAATSTGLGPGSPPYPLHADGVGTG